MEVIAAAIESGTLPKLIAGLVVVEAMVLVWLWRTRGIGIAPRAALGSLASGAVLMLAVAAAIAKAPWWDIATLLALSFVAHLADLALRWRSS